MKGSSSNNDFDILQDKFILKVSIKIPKYLTNPQNCDTIKKKMRRLR